MTTVKTLNWGIIGPGTIARAFADGVAHSNHSKLVAVASRAPGPDLATQFPGARVLAGYDALLADKEVEAVYIATPHPFHAEWAIKAAEAGKHVLVEKPLALSAFEIDAVFHAHRKAGTFAAEAYMYRLHPMTEKIISLVREGAIGEVRMIQSSFGYQMGSINPALRHFASDLAGGGILDVGGYPVSMARLIVGAATGQTVAEPVTTLGTANLAETGADLWAAAVLKFPNGIVAEVSAGILIGLDNVLRIHGSTGRLEVSNFWFASGHRGGTGHIHIHRPKGTVETIAIEEKGWLYAFEADAAALAIRAGKQEFTAPGMTWADSLGNARVLDKWRADAGIEYSVEKPAQRTRPLANRPLHKGNVIPQISIPGLNKKVSAVALGFEDFRTFASGAILLDAFYEKGGTLFDTGYIYAGGFTEKLLGDWHTSRGIREEIAIIGKGAHSPLCYPDVIGRQLGETLDRLKTDHVDVYFMHRDNLNVPVGEFVDAIDIEVKKGRIRGPWGGSNWTRDRMDAAIDYAHRTGKTAPGALSNNFALAEMLDPIWAGCVTSSTPAWKAWLTARQIPNFSWSSQARGFFTDRAGRDKRDNEELVRVWYNEQNFARRDRAIALAKTLGKSPIHVALAYVLAQPFPSIPLIGPRTLAELDDSCEAFSIALGPKEVTALEG
jgi:predicted dehydrogenase/aryl-alcohol dehydrogenase-like predicted oxidoreductase